jgi:hypothetical protein
MYMAEKSILKINSEDAYFEKHYRKQMEELRASAQQEANETYKNEHKNHCFRCGTHSLVEVQQGDVHIDICINEGCGAIHLDPGELEKILEGEGGLFGKIKSSVFSVFK